VVAFDERSTAAVLSTDHDLGSSAHVLSTSRSTSMYSVPVGIIGRGHIGRGELRTATSNSTRCNPGGCVWKGRRRWGVEGAEGDGGRGGGEGLAQGRTTKTHHCMCAVTLRSSQVTCTLLACPVPICLPDEELILDRRELPCCCFGG
jgi:hypothetical protein